MVDISAKIYADALIELGQKGDISFDEIKKDMSVTAEILQKSPDLKNVLTVPVFSLEQQLSVADEVFKPVLNYKILNFIKILIEKRRFNEFDKITEAFYNAVDDFNEIKRVTIISAVDLDEENKRKITDKLQTKLQKNIHTNWIVNEEIIGGLVIKIDDDVIDTSIKTKLENISKNIIKGNL